MSGLQKIKALFKAPHVDDDPFVIRKINLLNTLLWIVLGFTLLFLPLEHLILATHETGLILNSLLALATIICLVLVRRGKIRFAAIFILTTLWIYMSLSIYFFGGITSPATISFVFFILASGLLFEEAGIIGSALLSMFSCTLVWQLEVYGRFPLPVTIEKSRYWLAIMIVLLVSSCLFYAGFRSLNTALGLVNHTKQNLEQLIARRSRDLSLVNEKLLAEIASREQVENAFEESENRFRHLFNSSPDAMFLMDPHHPEVPWMIVECNQAACKMNGYRRDELVGKAIFMLDANPDPKAIENTSIALFRDRTIFFEGEHVHKDGHIFPVEVALTVVIIGGKEYLLGQDRDITRRREAEEALKRIREELEKRVLARTADLTAANEALQTEIRQRQEAEQSRQRLIEELEAKNNELEQFTYTVSHDLKSPLITIRGFLNFIESDLAKGNTVRAQNDMRRVILAADKMQAMLENLLELSRIGHVSNPPTAVSLSYLVTEAIESLDGSIRAKEVTIHQPETMPDVFVDATRLVEVFQNLISNAVKFMGKQAHPAIHIFIAEETESEVTCAIQDNGIGIEPHNQEKIFAVFARVDGEVEGTGIGLALVKRIVEVNNGRVWLESEGHKRGCTFFLALPKPDIAAEA